MPREHSVLSGHYPVTFTTPIFSERFLHTQRMKAHESETMFGQMRLCQPD